MSDPTPKDSPTKEPSAFERFENFARKLIAVPKREIDRSEKDDEKPGS